MQVRFNISQGFDSGPVQAGLILILSVRPQVAFGEQQKTPVIIQRGRKQSPPWIPNFRQQSPPWLLNFRKQSPPPLKAGN